MGAWHWVALVVGVVSLAGGLTHVLVPRVRRGWQGVCHGVYGARGPALADAVAWLAVGAGVPLVAWVLGSVSGGGPVVVVAIVVLLVVGLPLLALVNALYLLKRPAWLVTRSLERYLAREDAPADHPADPGPGRRFAAPDDREEPPEAGPGRRFLGG